MITTAKSPCSRYKHFHDSSFLARKRFPDHFFAFLPQRFRVVWIERITAHAFANAANHRGVRHDFPHMAVLAIAATDLPSRRNNTRPYGRRCPLRDRLPRERPLSLRGELIVHLFNHAFEAAPVHVPAELSLDDSRMRSRGAHPTFAVPLVEGDGE